MLYHPPSNIADMLRQPSIVPRESLRSNPDVHMRLAQLGLGSIVDVESTSNVLVSTRNRRGHIVAAGILVNPLYKCPEIHVRAGEISGFVSDTQGNTRVAMEIDEVSVAAASLTWSELLKIARQRGEFMVQGFSVGTPSGNPVADFREVGRSITLPNEPATKGLSPDQNLHTRIAC